MDCNTARLFLHFSRPQAGELEAAAVEGLDAHIGHCPNCAALVRDERRIEQHFGRAMRQVDVPDGLRERLLKRLATDRSDWYRRWAGHGVRVVAAAAVLLLLVWGWSRYRIETRPVLDVSGFANFVRYQSVRPGNWDEVENDFAEKMDVKIEAPRELNSAHLSHYGLAPLPGHKGIVVPVLLFEAGAKRAICYIVADKRFKLDPLNFEEEQHGYERKLRVGKSPSGHFAYLLLYTGESSDWVWPEPKSS